MSTIKEKAQKVIKERGKADKVYCGDVKSTDFAREMTKTEVVFNPERYKGVMVLAYGKQKVEIKADTKPPKKEYEKKPASSEKKD